MRCCVRIVDTVGRGWRPSAERKLPLRNSVENFGFAALSALRHREGYSYNARLDRGRSGQVSPVRMAQRFQPCIAGRGSERRNAILPKLMTMIGRAL